MKNKLLVVLFVAVLALGVVAMPAEAKVNKACSKGKAAQYNKHCVTPAPPALCPAPCPPFGPCAMQMIPCDLIRPIPHK